MVEKVTEVTEKPIFAEYLDVGWTPAQLACVTHAAKTSGFEVFTQVKNGALLISLRGSVDPNKPNFYGEVSRLLGNPELVQECLKEVELVLLTLLSEAQPQKAV